MYGQIKGVDGVSEKKRLSELSYLNVIFTLLVIFVHILGEPVMRLTDRASVQYFAVFTPWKLFQFVTQGFIFLSGIKLFIKKRDSINIGRFYLDRVKRVVVPYVIWVVIYYLYFVFNSYYAYKFTFKDLVHYIITGDISAQFYFVVLIVQFYLLTPVIMKLFKKCSTELALLYSLFVSLILGENLPRMLKIISPEINFLYNDRIFTTYIFYFVAGAFVGINYDAVKNALRRSKWTVYITGAAFAALNLFLSYIGSKTGTYFGFEYYLMFAYSVSMILVCFTFFCGFAEKHGKLPRIIAMTDRSSFMLYLSHILILYIVRGQLDAYGINDAGMRLVLTVLCLVLYIVLSVIIWELTKKQGGKIVCEYKLHIRKK